MPQNFQKSRSAFFSRHRDTNVRRARDIETGSARNKAVYMVTCDHAGNKDGGLCTTKLDTIVHETESSKSSVLRAHADLERRGLISPVYLGQCVHYLVHIPQGDVQTRGATVAPNDAEKGATQTPIGVTVTPNRCHTDTDRRHTDTYSAPKNAENDLDGQSVTDDRQQPKGLKGYKRRESESGSRSRKSEDGSKKNSAAVPLSPDWKPAEADRQFGHSLGLTWDKIERATTKFRRHHLDKAGVSADWSEKFRLWLGDDAQKAGCKPSASASATAPVPMASRYFAEVGSPQWDAWKVHWQNVRGIDPPRTQFSDQIDERGQEKSGWCFKTEWPPEAVKSEQQKAA